MDRVKALWSSYLHWVAEHPQLATDIETSIKWISYIATGYFRNSSNSLLWSELVYSLSDLMKFVNDRAYEQAFHVSEALEYEKVEHLLAFLDSAEIFVEVGAFLAGGTPAKWVMISTIQVLKSTWRAIYVIKKKRMIKRPLFDAIDRSEYMNEKKESIVLPRTGRTMRPMSADFRWNVAEESTIGTALDQQQVIAELAFILQPLIHLSTLGLFGFKSWIPWVSSVACDVASQALHWRKMSGLSKWERGELWRRRQALLLYLLRSPLYDIGTKRIIVGIFLLARPKIPFSRHLSDFLMAYVPHYRRIYAHLWSR